MLVLQKQPSARNARIYELVRIQRRTQASVAKKYGITQAQVSRICQKVRRFYMMNSAIDEEPSFATVCLFQRDYIAQLEFAQQMAAENNRRKPDPRSVCHF